MKLSGATVAVTRPRMQAAVMTSALSAAGARVLEVPLIRIVAAVDDDALKRAAARAHDFDWVVFTSANAVDALFGAMSVPYAAWRARIACIGPATAESVRAHGHSPELISAGGTAEDLLDALVSAGVGGMRVLLPQAAGARPVLGDGLRRAGAKLDAIEAYRTEGDTVRAAELGAFCRSGAVDIVTFTASSAVRTFVAGAGPNTGKARVAVIGPVTAATAQSLGLSVDIEAGEPTVAGLLAAIHAAPESTA